MAQVSSRDLLIRAKLINEVSRPVQQIRTDIGQLGRDIDKAGDATRSQAREFNRLSGEYKRAQNEARALGRHQVELGRQLTQKLTVPAVLGLGLFIKKASDLNEVLSVNRVTFGRFAGDMEAWSRTSARTMGQSQAAALDAAATFGGLFQNLDVAQGKAAQMAQQMVKLSADLASARNTSTQEAGDAIRSFLAGETEPIRRYNVFANEQVLKQRALALGYRVTGATLEPAVRMQAAYAELLRQTGMYQGDFERTAGGTANRLRTFTSVISDTAAALGTTMLPTTAAVLDKFTSLLEIVGHLPSPFRAAIVAGFGIAAVAGPIVYIAGRVKLLRVELENARLASLRLNAALGSTGNPAIRPSGVSGFGGMVNRVGTGRLVGGAVALGGLGLALGAGGSGSIFGDAANVAGMAMTGAGIGSFFGPGPGTAIGAGIGGALGLGQSLWSHFGHGNSKASSEAKKTASELNAVTAALDKASGAAGRHGDALGKVAGEYAELRDKVDEISKNLGARLDPALDSASAALKQRQALLALDKVRKDPKASEADRTSAMLDVISSTRARVSAMQSNKEIAATESAAARAIQQQLGAVAMNVPQLAGLLGPAGLGINAQLDDVGADARAAQVAALLLSRLGPDRTDMGFDPSKPWKAPPTGPPVQYAGREGWYRPSTVEDIRRENLNRYGVYSAPRPMSAASNGAAPSSDGGDTLVFQIDARGSTLGEAQFRKIAEDVVEKAGRKQNERHATPLRRV